MREIRLVGDGAGVGEIRRDSSGALGFPFGRMETFWNQIETRRLPNTVSVLNAAQLYNLKQLNLQHMNLTSVRDDTGG